MAWIRILTMFVLLGCCSLGAVAADEIPGVEKVLKNERIVATFNDRGLVSIRDSVMGKTLAFRDESSLVEATDHRMDTNSVKPTVETAPDSITYTFRFDDSITMRAVYELKPGWRFVSKQLLITPDKGDSIFVKRVEAFRGHINNPIAYSHFIDRGWKGVWAGMLRFAGTSDNDPGFGAFLLIQTPLMKWSPYYQDMNLSYQPDMEWKNEWGPFATDRVCIGVYPLSGNMFPNQPLSDSAYIRNLDQLVDWSMKVDASETSALQDCVRQFMMPPLPQKSIRLDVGWCYNDYQIDVGTPEGRAEYKRVIDRAAQMGIDTILFCAANSQLSSLKENRDAWGWENVLWLGLGQKIRKDEWDPAKDPIPASLKEIIDYAKSKNVKLMAYVYPTVPFMQDLAWTKWCNNQPGGYAGPDNGLRSFQDWLIKKLVDFQKKTGVAGYSFDLWYTGGATSQYAQWYGMRRVLEELKKQIPDIIIDGRQSLHAYGPWTSLSGCYPHPFGYDEQPGSFRATPDLHTDRLSANHMRSMNWMFRMQGFFPTELTPGYICHQTQRGDEKGTLRKDRFRARDWDYLGWRYSVISSIATAPFIHVSNFIPARDEDEFKAFSKADQQWYKGWMDWTDQHRDVLINLRPITTSPAIGRTDGTTAVKEDHGYVFFFNPNYRKMAADFRLDRSIDLTKGDRFIITQIYPRQGMLIGKPNAGVWSYGDKVTLPMQGASAVVLEIKPAGSITQPIVFNALGKASLGDGKLTLGGVSGEIGTQADLSVVLPDTKAINAMTVNGKAVEFTQNGAAVSAKIAFEGTQFGQCQQVGTYDPNNTGTSFAGEFTIPKRIFDQLAARKKAWPVPYTEDDLLATWLGPNRLLMLVSIADANPKMQISVKIDGEPVQVKQAWNGIYPSSGDQTFIGNYVDISNLKPDTKYRLEVSMPELEPGRFLGVYFDNVETEYTQAISATK